MGDCSRPDTAVERMAAGGRYLHTLPGSAAGPPPIPACKAHSMYRECWRQSQGSSWMKTLPSWKTPGRRKSIGRALSLRECSLIGP
jgi:hypothetical protein